VKAPLLAGLLLTGSGLHAQEAPVADPMIPVRHGYAFDRPELLQQQRIFGLAHGVHLLLSACHDKNENADAAQRAYASWHERQREAIGAVRAALAAHHFGAQAGQAQWQDVARALGLRETVYPSLGAISLQEACATLPAALAQERYDFAAQLDTPRDAARE